MSSDKEFPPYGYVAAESWRCIYEISDPGDIARPCPVKFFPHVDYVNSGEYFQVMSVSEHSAILSEKEKEIKRYKEALESIAQEPRDEMNLQKALEVIKNDTEIAREALA